MGVSYTLRKEVALNPRNSELQNHHEYFTKDTYEEIHNYIEENNVKPSLSPDGYIAVAENEEVVIYQKNEGYIGYFFDSETRENREAKKEIRKNAWQVR